MRLLKTATLLAVLALRSVLCAEDRLPDGLYAEFTTPPGVVVVELFAAKVPLTVTSFVGLAEGMLAPRDGKPFYTGLTWYRVVPGFVIQSGNPGLKDTGDDSIPHKFTDEFVPGLHHGEMGVLSMANAGPDTNGCEFFLTLGDDTRLNYLHSVFGRVVRGGEALPKIKQDDAFTIKILRIGAAAQAFKANPATFRALQETGGKYNGEPEPGPASHFDDAAKVLPTEVPRAKNFNYKLNNFQRATGQRIYARVYPTFTPTEAKETPAPFTQKLARSLGLYKDGVLAVYFADKDQWYLWVGEDLMPAFNPEKQKTMDAKNTLYAAVKAKAAEYTELARKTRGPDNPLKPADLAKYSVDAMLDLLILRFEPKP
ncbi:MAG TPA: peptidylprolyl isomerase [Lacunisphaera sp.]|nr:peptidylprolyl isomerase [Lacunisphaera sp.]